MDTSPLHSVGMAATTPSTIERTEVPSGTTYVGCGLDFSLPMLLAGITKPYSIKTLSNCNCCFVNLKSSKFTPIPLSLRGGSSDSREPVPRTGEGSGTGAVTDPPVGECG